MSKRAWTSALPSRVRRALWTAVSAFVMALPVQAQNYPAPSAISFVPLDLAGHVGGLEPVLSVELSGVTKIYPLRILSLHGVVNDTINGQSLALTYCGPCGTVGAFRTNGTSLRAKLDEGGAAMLLEGPRGALWSQADGEALGARQSMLKALPSAVVSMARARQAARADDVVLVLQDTQRSRIPSPKTLALPGQRVATPGSEDDEQANTTKVLDARSWSLDVLSPERRLGNEERLILLEKRQGAQQGPPAP